MTAFGWLRFGICSARRAWHDPRRSRNEEVDASETRVDRTGEGVEEFFCEILAACLAPGMPSVVCQPYSA